MILTEKGCWIRAEYDKNSYLLNSRRYAEKTKVGSGAANLRLIVIRKDVHGAEASFCTTNSGDKAPDWANDFVEWYEEGQPEQVLS